MSKGRAVTPLLLGGFFVFAATMTALVALTMLAPGAVTDAIWTWKQAEHEELLALRPWIGWAFAALSAVFVAASYGAFARKRWAWPLAVVIFVANGLGDALQFFRSAFVEGAIGVTVTTAIVYLLTRPQRRALFDR